MCSLWRLEFFVRWEHQVHKAQSGVLTTEHFHRVLFTHKVIHTPGAPISSVGSAGIPCAEALPGPLLHVTPPLSHPVSDHLSEVVLSIKPCKGKKKKKKVTHTSFILDKRNFIHHTSRYVSLKKFRIYWLHWIHFTGIIKHCQSISHEWQPGKTKCILHSGSSYHTHWLQLKYY